MDLKVLVNKAIETSKNCPNYPFKVGATLVTKEDKIYTGCNIGNQGIQSLCAERVVFAKAISEGEKDFKCILVVGKNDSEEFFKETLPCGYCRQFMSEFCDDEFVIYSYDQKEGKTKKYTLGELLPHSFKL